MDPRKSEKLLFFMYLTGGISCLISGIGCGVAWDYWRLTLDHCVGRNCSCILYGQSTPTHFLGGSAASCGFVVFGPIPLILTCIVFAGYHGVRFFMGPKPQTTRTVTTKNQAGEVIQLQVRAEQPKNALSRTYWIVMSVVTVIFTIYMFAHFIVYIHGFVTTCNQYRRKLIELLRITGTAVAVFDGRLSCNAVFDFMDYVQPNVGIYYRTGFINTAASLIIGFIGSAMALAEFFVAAFINIRFARSTP